MRFWPGVLTSWHCGRCKCSRQDTPQGQEPPARTLGAEASVRVRAVSQPRCVCSLCCLPRVLAGLGPGGRRHCARGAAAVRLSPCGPRGCVARRAAAGSRGASVPVLRPCCASSTVPVTSPWQGTGAPVSPCLCQHLLFFVLVFVFFLDNSHPNGCQVVSHCCSFFCSWS